MKYYYLVQDYCGWCVYRTEDINDVNKYVYEFEYQFVTTCLDTANRMREVLLAKERLVAEL